MCEIELAIIAVDRDSTQVVGREHVLAMSRTVDPSLHSTLDCISMTIVIGNVLSEGSLEEGDHIVALLEAVVADWALTLRHVHTVRHCDIVQFLVPSERWQLVTGSELVREIE